MRAWIPSLLLLLVACGAPTQPASPPSPPPAALEFWADFPATANPRPILWFESPGPEKGFTSGDAKIAAACSRFRLASGLTLPSSTPSEAVANWPDGTSVSYRAISAVAVFAAMSRPVPGANPQCTTVTPLELTAVRLGTAGIYTDRGMVQVTAWIFDGPGANGDLAYPALEPSAFWKRSTLSDHFGGNSAIRSTDDKSLDYGFIGGPPGEGSCHNDYTASVTESDSAVVVALEPYSSGNCAGSGADSAVGYFRTVTVKLNKPLGGRVLVDGRGLGAVVCPPETQTNQLGGWLATCRP